MFTIIIIIIYNIDLTQYIYIMVYIYNIFHLNFVLILIQRRYYILYIIYVEP